MKIKAIIASETKIGEITLRTEPRLTSDVFDFLRKRVWDKGTAKEFIFNVSTGHLTFRRSQLSKQEVTQIETALTTAENEVGQTKTATVEQHEGFLKRVSQDSGLPLE